MEFIRTVELINPLEFIDKYDWKGIGRKPSDRLCLIKAFIPKPIFKFTQTITLIDAVKSSPALRRLCGEKTAVKFHQDPLSPERLVFFLKQNCHNRYMKQW
jgi:hypothetical protein